MISMSVFSGGSPAFSALPDVHADGHDAKTGMRQAGARYAPTAKQQIVDVDWNAGALGRIFEPSLR